MARLVPAREPSLNMPMLKVCDGAKASMPFLPI